MLSSVIRHSMSSLSSLADLAYDVMPCIRPELPQVAQFWLSVMSSACRLSTNFLLPHVRGFINGVRGAVVDKTTPAYHHD